MYDSNGWREQADLEIGIQMHLMNCYRVKRLQMRIPGEWWLFDEFHADGIVFASCYIDVRCGPCTKMQRTG